MQTCETRFRLTCLLSVISRLVLLLLVAVTGGCGARLSPRSVVDAPHYVVRDTAEYESMLSGGEYGLLMRDGIVIDSVDLLFGVHTLNNGEIVFLPVEPIDVADSPRAMDITEHMAFDGRNGVTLNSILPNFSDYFSSPSVIEGILYYWGLELSGEGEYRLHAQSYDAQLQKIRSCFLIETEVATDSRGHFAQPVATDQGVRFATHGYDFLVSRNLTSFQDTGELRPCRMRS